MDTGAYQTPSKNTALITGTAIGVAGAIFTFINFPLQGLISTALTVGILVWGMKQYRDRDLGGYMSFGKGFGFGMIAALIGSLIKAVSIYFKPIDAEIREEAYTAFSTELEKNDASIDEETINMIYSFFDSFLSPTGLSLISFFSYVLWGTIVSLVVAGILNKNNTETY